MTYLLILSALLLSSCSAKMEGWTYLNQKNLWQSASDNFDFDLFDIKTTIYILDEDQKPIPQAKVYFGMTPTGADFLMTDASGKVEVDNTFTQAIPITVYSPTHVFTSFLNQNLKIGETNTYNLKKAPAQTPYELSGDATGFQVVNKDGWGDFGVSFPILNNDDLTFFQLNRIISFERDKTSAAGQTLYVPSNISLPKQSENYSIVTVTLDKVNYKTQFEQPGLQNVYSVYGRFPFKKVIDEFRNGKEFTELLNYFTFYTGNIAQINLQNQKTNANLPVNGFGFKGSKTILTPAIPSGYLLIGNSLSTTPRGQFYITDVKRLPSQTTLTMAVHDMNNPYLQLSFKDEKKISAGPGTMILSTVLLPFANQLRPEILPLMSQLQFDSQILNLVLPQALPVSKTLTAMGSVIRLGMVTYYKNTKGEIRGEKTTPFWEVYSTDWSQNYDLPKFTFQNLQTARVTLSLLAAEKPEPFILGPELIKKSTHATTTSNNL